MHQVISEYNRYSETAIETPGRGGRRSSYLSLVAEREFLAPFIALAKQGKISTRATIQAAFEQQVGESVAPSTIYRLLERHHWHKLVSRPLHPQADLEAQAAFKLASAGRPTLAHWRPTRHQSCTAHGSLFAPMTFAGLCNRALFERWLEECLLPQLHPGDVIAIDNASFYHSQAIEEIVSQAGCEIWYLPPYSPDLNRIEHWWFVLKNWMRQRWDEFDSFRDCVDAAFKECPNVFA